MGFKKSWMRTLGIFILLVLTCYNVHAQNKISIVVKNFSSNNGFCRACLFDNAYAFSNEKGTALRCVKVAVINKSSNIVFDNTAAGTYAVSVFHDANNNNKLDKNFLGIPKEGYGASKNKLPFASAPAFNDNKFIVTNNIPVNLTINLRYL